MLAVLIPIIILGQSGCSSLRKDGELAEAEAGSPNETAELRSSVAQMVVKISELESKLLGLNEKLETLSKTPKQELIVQGVTPHPAENAGKTVPARATPFDPAYGFTNDDAIRDYRKAMVLFQADKLPEAVLAFSQFVEGHPDHVLAGSAQFYVGESYFRQKEYQLALNEFRKVLTSYDRSRHVSETLRQISLAEDALKQTQDAARHRQLLLSLFPQSPAARMDDWIPVSHPPSAPATETAATEAQAPAAVSATDTATPSALDEPPVPIAPVPVAETMSNPEEMANE